MTAVMAASLLLFAVLLAAPSLGFGLVVLATYHAIRKNPAPRTRASSSKATRCEALYDAYTMTARSRRGR